MENKEKVSKTQYDRTKLLIGDKIEILKKSSVIIFGVGGVGGYVTEMLARAGVQNITVVDFDSVDITNINRQIIALHSTIGFKKVNVIKSRLLDIDPNINIRTFDDKVSCDNLNKFFDTEYDYVIDAIDDVSAKIAIIKYCNENNIKIISALGAGNRIVCPNFKVCDIFKTENDGLAKRLRKELRNLNIKKLNVCFCDILPLKVNGFIGSISYYPAMSGCTIASFVISELIK